MRFSQAVNSLSSVTSWKTSPIEERTPWGLRAQSKPFTMALPELCARRVQRMFIVVVFPAPFGPRNPKISPSITSKLTPFTALSPL